MDENSIDHTLWNQFRAGDEMALGSLMRRHYRVLYQYATRFTNDTDFVKDCIQELFLELLDRHQQIGEVRYVRTYLLTSLRRKLHKEHLRQRNSFVAAEIQEELAFAAEFSIEKQIIEEERVKEEAEKITHILNLLPKRQKEILYLRYFQELNHEEIAEVMSLTPQAVYNLLSKSLKQVKSYWHSNILLFFVTSTISYLLYFSYLYGCGILV